MNSRICLVFTDLSKPFGGATIMSTSGKDMLPGSLSMEQQFTLQVLKDQVQGLSLEQAQEYVIEVMRQMMVKDNLVKHLLKNA